MLALGQETAVAKHAKRGTRSEKRIFWKEAEGEKNAQKSMGKGEWHLTLQEI